MSVNVQDSSLSNSAPKVSKPRGFRKWFGRSHDRPNAQSIVSTQPAAAHIIGTQQVVGALPDPWWESNSPQASSLWDQAYKSLGENNANSVNEYERLLIRETQEAGLPSDHPRQVKLQCIIDRGLERLEKNKTKFNIAGHEFNLSNQIANAASLATWARGLVAEAVKASPEASIAWAGVCLILPLLTSPKTASEANSAGFKYVTTRMRYYSALEPLLARLGLSSRVSSSLMEAANNDIAALYQHVIEFQIRSVLRFYRSHFTTYARDVLTRDDWKQMQDRIIDLEKIARRDLNQINELVSREALDSLDYSSQENLKTMERLHSIAGQHLGVAEDQRDIAKQQLQLQTAASQQLLGVVEEQKHIAKQQLQLQTAASRRALSEMEEKCRQIFRLTDNGTDATYEWYRDRIEPRVPGTCEWFLNHKSYHEWLRQRAGPLLVTADPGCGKSVLAKHLVEEVLPKSTTVCYFFFKQGDQSTTRQALCAILHQLFSQHRPVVRHAVPEYERNGTGLTESTSALWSVLMSSAQDPQTGPLTIVLDAIDECDNPDFQDLIRRLQRLFEEERETPSNLKWLLTSRPYGKITSEFEASIRYFPHVHVSASGTSEAIGKEVIQVIKYRIAQLNLPSELKGHMIKHFLQVPQRTYLWAHLVFEHVRTNLKLTPKGFDSILGNLPKTVNEAYEGILSKSQDDPMVGKALSIILAASRPLSVTEMNVALNMSDGLQSLGDLDLEEEEYFTGRLRSWCGLFVSIYQNKVYFLHQSCREFLLAKSSSQGQMASPPPWKHSISHQYAHACLAEICVLSLDLLNFGRQSRPRRKTRTASAADSRAFLDYAARHWGLHYCESGIGRNRAVWERALRICDPRSKAHSAWSKACSDYPLLSPLMQVASVGQAAVMDLFLRNRANIEEADTLYRRTPLLWASKGGHAATVDLLLRAGANLNAQEDKTERTALVWATELGHVEVVNALLWHGASIHEMGYPTDWTPLHRAVFFGHLAVVELLLTKGAEWCQPDWQGRTPTWLAASRGHLEILRMLLRMKGDAEFKDQTGSTPFMEAAANGHVKIMKLLLENMEIDVEQRDNYGRTALARAVDAQRPEAVRMLLKKRANVNVKDGGGMTPLYMATRRENKVCMDLLLAAGADYI
ncbi:hypothetical protein C2857_005142 [Epichloe festucae Fl1]|uniref:NWD NACHT-NTPase N-terminal domain-containing protein n=1 Tax=Epichloe festucae (strain Fl1) TaxID=877507 RepID=A0A7S9PUC1_EPIFF|nr:hypothetical protein C2857_005142 [Epichloe festucae Fl1]